ncbi:MAG: hypothetical protein BGO55_02050 [Sphingobacteriales bacterium 50-39]|nr:DUF3857 domain-containing protein [Sphingobacteriales bacterium]OJW55357.1 MAG: hypothetical protein BGO55_02050 [Sphingobacteriales bacterium 50-39]
MMKPPRPIVLIVSILFLSLLQRYCVAQDKSKLQFVKPNPGDFKTPAGPIIDTSVGAVILSDYGATHFVGNKNGWFSYVYQLHTRIQILNKKAFDLAKVEVTLYTKDNDPETVDNIAAATYNLDNGVVSEVRLDKKDIFEDRKDKNHIEKKFTLPAVREGSIIEYTYTMTSPYNYNLPSWEFQSSEYPCLNSEYEVEIPQALFYVVVRQGVHPFDIDKGSEGHASYSLTEKENVGGIISGEKTFFVNANTTKHRWVMKNIPPLKEEGYLSTPRNYLDRISFQLSKTYDGSDYHDHTNTWAKATEELLKREDFGEPLTDDKDWLNALLAKITAGVSEPLGQAKAIYYYTEEHFTCTDHYYARIKTDLHDVLKKNSGTVGDINLLLAAMLRQKGFQADPVLLSTREYGFNLAKYPILDRLNYVIVRLSLGGVVYYLDAAHPELGFGQLAGNCYNGHARVISDKDSGSVYFEADSLHEKRTTMVFLINGAGGLEGTYQAVLGPVESYNVRRRVSDIGEKEYFKKIQTSYGEDLELGQTNLDSLDKKEDPITVRYSFALKQASGASMLYFNPFFGDIQRENPFKAADRKYPVEMPYTTDNLYLLNLEIPEGYDVEELPKSARVALNGDEGSFEYLIARQDNMIQLRCRIKLNKANFPADDYASLRDFYAFVVKKQSEQIILKKK